MVRRSPAWWVGFGLLLTVTMGSATFITTPIAVFAPDLLQDFSIGRWQVGAVVTASALSGAILAPVVGHLTDRLGGRRAAALTLVFAAAGLALMAGASSYSLLLVAGVISGAGQGMCNPATNTLIGDHVPLGRRGVITGIKQSGVQAASAVGGALLPLTATAVGWRGAVLGAAMIPVAGLGLTAVAEPHPGRWNRGPGNGVHATVNVLAAFGFLLGYVNSALFTYLPLFSREMVGWEGSGPGMLITLSGVAGVVGRILWGRASERRLGYRNTLTILAAASVGAAGLMLAAPLLGGPALVSAALLAGGGTASWNAVGMLAVIELASPGTAGRASGRVLAGFLLGFGSGAPLTGLLVDLTGSYLLPWVAVGLLSILAIVTARRLVAAHAAAYS